MKKDDPSTDSTTIIAPGKTMDDLHPHSWPRNIRERVATTLEQNFTAADAILNAIDYRIRNPPAPPPTCFCGRFGMREGEAIDGRNQYHSTNKCFIKYPAGEKAP